MKMVVDEDSLLSYLDGTMSEEDQHKLELLLEDDPFMSDALEGLARVNNPAEVKRVAAQLNRKLAGHIEKRNGKLRHSSRLSDRWAVVVLVFILIIAVLGWWLLRLSVAQ